MQKVLAGIIFLTVFLFSFPSYRLYNEPKADEVAGITDQTAIRLIFDTNAVEKAVICDGSSGNIFLLDNTTAAGRNMLPDLCKMVQSVDFSPVRDYREYESARYTLQFFNAQDQSLCYLRLGDENHCIYEDQLCEVVRGQYDIQMLKNIIAAFRLSNV